MTLKPWDSKSLMAKLSSMRCRLDGDGIAASRLGRVIHQQQDPARLQRARQLIEHAAGVDFRPVAAFRIHPVQIVIHLDQEHRIQARRLQIHMIEIDGLMLDIGQAVLDPGAPAAGSLQ